MPVPACGRTHEGEECLGRAALAFPTHTVAQHPQVVQRVGLNLVQVALDVALQVHKLGVANVVRLPPVPYLGSTETQIIFIH